MGELDNKENDEVERLGDSRLSGVGNSAEDAGWDREDSDGEAQSPLRASAGEEDDRLHSESVAHRARRLGVAEAAGEAE